jgi:hypothetical protein
MLKERLLQLVSVIKEKRSNYEFIQIEKETDMPMGKGTYGSKKGRPPKKKMAGKGLTAKQKTLPSALQKKIMKSKKKK